MYLCIDLLCCPVVLCIGELLCCVVLVFCFASRAVSCCIAADVYCICILYCGILVRLPLFPNKPYHIVLTITLYKIYIQYGRL